VAQTHYAKATTDFSPWHGRAQPITSHFSAISESSCRRIDNGIVVALCLRPRETGSSSPAASIRSIMFPRPLRMRTLLHLLIAFQLSALSTTAVAQFPVGSHRVPWTTSKLAGSPDPPLPYIAEVVFPKLRFDRPLLIVYEPGARRMVVGEIAGKVLSFANDPAVERAEVAIDLAKARPGTTALYGLAFHPKFTTNAQVFVCYTMGDGPDRTRVSRFKADQREPLRIDPSTEEVLLTFFGGGHNGGCLQFGRDEKLYISTGDAANPTPPDGFDTGQNLSDVLGSILRIDVDNRDPGKNYRVPHDNPFVGRSGARPEIWAYGLRNPWRMSFDRANGDLWVGDVGWELWELIYRVERGGNYGWSIMEGRQPIRPEGKRGPTPILPPTADHPHSEAASITGGYVYRGRALPSLVGVYIYGDYQSGKVWGLRHDGKTVTWRGELADTGLRIASFGEDEAGELYLVEHERSNQIYRLVPNPVRESPSVFPRLLSQSGLFASTKDLRRAEGVTPYAINAEAWSDGTRGERLLAVPGDGRIALGEGGRFKLPEGSVLARTVTLDLTAGDAATRKRLETQILHFESGSWRPYTYVWNDDQSDAALLDAAGAVRTFNVRDPNAPGGQRELKYRFAARSECALCHNPWVEAKNTVFGRQSASPLAFDASQLDRTTSSKTNPENQLKALERFGYFEKPLPPSQPLANPYDAAADLESRARAYLQVNCSHCHQFNAGGATTIVLGASLPLAQTKTVNERPSQGSFGIDDARIIAAGEPDRSVLYYRIAKTGAGRMPRAGSHHVDPTAARLLADWIAGMPATAGVATRQNPQDDRSLERLRDIRSATASDRSAAIRQLLSSTSASLRLVREIDRGEIAQSVLREVATLAKDHPRGEIRDLFERFLPDSERIQRLGDRVDPAVLLAIKGDAERGRLLFASESSAQCRTCHRIGVVGADLGPDLSGIGAKYMPADLLKHILEPGRDVDPKYSLFAVATKSGQVFAGLLARKSGDEVVLRDNQNHEIRIAAADIEEQGPRPGSIMPDGLFRDLTAQQAADLLKYLSEQKTPPPTSPR
jgi:putative heme-binding domain-containing protein